MKFRLIIILYLLSNLFTIISGQAITSNPIEIINTNYSLVFDSKAGYYNIVVFGQFFVMKKSDRTVKRNMSFEVDLPQPPIAFLKTDSNNHYLFAENNYYNFDIDQNVYEIQSITGKNIIGKDLGFLLTALYESGIDCYGFLAEKGESVPHESLQGRKVNMDYDEIVLYAIFNNVIYFYYFKPNFLYPVTNADFSGYENHISCKLVDSSEYVCALTKDNQVQILIFILRYISDSENEIAYINDYNIIGYTNHDYGVLNDIPGTNERKILCARKKDTNKIDCIMINVIIEEDRTSSESIIQYSSSIEPISLNRYYEFLSFQMDNCCFTGFHEEYLFCCGREDKIHCYRYDKNFIDINNFEIRMEGINYNLTIINNNDRYASLFYINTISGVSKLYEYFIYPPKCLNISEVLITSNTFERNINNFFYRKDNIKYYLEFLTLPLELGTVKLNDNTISINNYVVEINNNEQIFSFKPNENLEEQTTSIIYNIYQETYSVTCKIELALEPCYHSCKTCSLSIKSSGVDDHNCDSCKENYYPFSHKQTNCYNETEGRSHTHWYFDSVQKMFDECSAACLTCSGPTENDCLSCRSEEDNILYLYNGKCRNICPENTFPDKNGNNQNICKDCYTNCKTCNKTGFATEMLCTSCSDEDIKFGSNCYRIYDQENKLFHNPENNEVITSCKEYRGLYIKDDGNECIPKPDYNYFVSNETTGLLSSCDADCLTCIGKASETSKNCIKCSGTGLFSQDGNCVSQCSEGYLPDNINLICIKCHKNCLTCQASPTYNPLNNLISMGCLSCNESFIFIKTSNAVYDGFCFPKLVYEENKITFDISEYDSTKTEGSCFYFGLSIFYGNNSCTEKPQGTYYKINDESNTGVIEYCNIACSSCDQQEEEGNTNCISCSNG